MTACFGLKSVFVQEDALLSSKVPSLLFAVNIWTISRFTQKRSNPGPYRVVWHDITAATLVYQTNPVGVELFSYVNTFCSNKFARGSPCDWQRSTILYQKCSSSGKLVIFLLVSSCYCFGVKGIVYLVCSVVLSKDIKPFMGNLTSCFPTLLYTRRVVYHAHIRNLREQGSFDKFADYFADLSHMLKPWWENKMNK